MEWRKRQWNRNNKIEGGRLQTCWWTIVYVTKARHYRQNWGSVFTKNCFGLALWGVNPGSMLVALCIGFFHSCFLNVVLQVKHWHCLSCIHQWYQHALGHSPSCFVCWASCVPSVAQYWLEVAHCHTGRKLLCLPNEGVHPIAYSVSID